MLSSGDRKKMKAMELTKKQDQLKDRDEVRRIIREQLLEHMEGSGFWSDFADGFKKGFSAVMRPASYIIPYGDKIRAGMDMVGMGKGGRTRRGKTMAEEADEPVVLQDGYGNVIGKAKEGGLLGRTQKVGQKAPSLSHLLGLNHATDAYEKEGMDGKFFRKGEGFGAGKGAGMGAGKGAGKGAGMGAGKGAGKGGASAKMKKRNALIKKLMKQHGLTLPEASRKIKEDGLM